MWRRGEVTGVRYVEKGRGDWCEVCGRGEVPGVRYVEKGRGDWCEVCGEGER